MSEIKIDSEAMQSIVAKAVLEGIDANQREALLEQAVRYLITPPKGDRYGYGVSPATPLQTAFDNAVQASIHRTAVELVQGDEALQQRLKTLVTNAIADIMTEERYDDLAEAVRKSLGSTLSEFRKRDY